MYACKYSKKKTICRKREREGEGEREKEREREIQILAVCMHVLYIVHIPADRPYGEIERDGY